MAAALGDLIQFVDHQQYLGEQLLNVYYYRITSLTGLDDTGLEVLADWFETNVIDPVRNIQNSGLEHTVLEVRNLSNGVDFWEEPIGSFGLDTVAADLRSPSFMSVNFKLVRESLVTRNGSKRFSGLTDGAILGNTYSFGVGARESIETALAKDIVLGVVTVAEPIIVKRPIVPPVGSSYLYSSIGSAVYTGLGTQNTRKP